MSQWVYVTADHSVANRVNLDGSIDSRSILDAELAAWIAEGNTPDPYVTPAAPAGKRVEGVREF